MTAAGDDPEVRERIERGVADYTERLRRCKRRIDAAAATAGHGLEDRIASLRQRHAACQVRLAQVPDTDEDWRALAAGLDEALGDLDRDLEPLERDESAGGDEHP